jgi:TRAP-type C4-dicarboxylate transport system substrate-binding protein
MAKTLARGPKNPARSYQSRIAYNNAEILQREKDLLAKFQQEGMTIITPDLEEFRKAVLDTVPAMFEEKWGKGLWEQIQNVK